MNLALTCAVMIILLTIFSSINAIDRRFGDTVATGVVWVGIGAVLTLLATLWF